MVFFSDMCRRSLRGLSLTPVKSSLGASGRPRGGEGVPGLIGIDIGDGRACRGPRGRVVAAATVKHFPFAESVYPVSIKLVSSAWEITIFSFQIRMDILAK